MPLTVAFQMEPMEKVNHRKSNTLLLMEEAQKRGHIIYQYHPSELSFYLGEVVTTARKVHISRNPEPVFNVSDAEELNLRHVDVVFIRQDPPFDMEYITNTYLLEKIAGDTLMVNNPASVRDLPEKIYPTEFPEFIPPTLITANISKIAAFLEEQGDVILKPLYVFGGTDVYHFKKGEAIADMAAELLKKYEAPVVVQRFIPEVKEGDKRILLIDGEIVGTFLRIPEEGSVRANLMAGGSLHKAELTKRDKEICAAVGPRLKEQGIIICGIDIIGKYLTEINSTSPIGFKEVEKLYGTAPAADLWDVVERKL